MASEDINGEPLDRDHVAKMVDWYNNGIITREQFLLYIENSLPPIIFIPKCADHIEKKSKPVKNRFELLDL